jgi:restriction system protein
MNLIAKFLALNGKTIIESHVTGGSDDGGIDGIVRTVDALGFRELIMVQTKNRSDHSTETDVRGFYGAVCALQGSRGIFATSSDFHPMAKKLLDSIDNCVGVNGDMIFSMAEKTQYGIKKEGERLVIDHSIF